MRNILFFCTASLFIAAAAGCSSPGAHLAGTHQGIYHDESVLTAKAAAYPAIFNIARGLAAQLGSNMRDGTLADHPCVITTFADIDNLAVSSRFGRLLAEAMGAELFRQGAVLKDVRSTGSVMLAPGQGEFGLSRDVAETLKEVNASALVAGTYGVGSSTVAVTVRMIDVKTGGVLSVAMTEMARTDAVDALLEPGASAGPTVYDRL